MVDSYVLFKLSQYYPSDTMQEIFEAVDHLEKVANQVANRENLIKAASDDYVSAELIKQAMLDELIRTGLQKNSGIIEKGLRGIGRLGERLTKGKSGATARVKPTEDEIAAKFLSKRPKADRLLAQRKVKTTGRRTPSQESFGGPTIVKKQPPTPKN